MSLRPGDARCFWGHSADAAAILAERTRWMTETPERYLRVLPEGVEAVNEAIAFMRAQQDGAACSPAQAAVELEPDWIVLAGDAERQHPVVGGAVIFPSSWALEEKVGHPLHVVHAPVPGLQSSLGTQISTFLQRLAPQAAWERENWGLSADPSLNHHPAIAIRRLGGDATLATTWLRLERQFLTRLFATQAILFGIRVSNHRLDDLAALPAVAARLARALATMSEEVARYKGLHEARGPLISALESVS